MNGYTAIGRIGRDAVTRHTANGKAVTGWSLAVDSGWGEGKKTIWIDCALWGDRGEKVAPYLTKGALVGVTGELGEREHEGKKYITCTVANVTLTGKPSESGERTAKPAAKAQKPADDFDDSSIPF